MIIQRVVLVKIATNFIRPVSWSGIKYSEGLCHILTATAYSNRKSKHEVSRTRNTI